MRTRELAGTPVVYQEYGAGPATVIVHGLNSFAHDWAAVAGELEARGRRVLVPYRRGRAPSGPLGPGYTLSTEVGDLSALLNVAGPGTTLVGHSFGGLIALLTAPTRSDLGALVLYEPGVPGFRPDHAAALRTMSAALTAGDPDTALTVMITEIDGDPPERAARLRADPEWSTLTAGVDTAHTELTAFHATTPPDLSALPAVPTTVLVGEHTESQFSPAARAIVDAVPDARLIPLPGQGHLAHTEAPALLADLIYRA